MPTCAQCGQEFTPWKRQQAICSEECRLARKRDYEVRYRAARQQLLTCTRCGQQFQGRPGTLTCGRDCPSRHAAPKPERAPRPERRVRPAPAPRPAPTPEPRAKRPPRAIEAQDRAPRGQRQAHDGSLAQREALAALLRRIQHNEETVEDYEALVEGGRRLREAQEGRGRGVRAEVA